MRISISTCMVPCCGIHFSCMSNSLGLLFSWCQILSLISAGFENMWKIELLLTFGSLSLSSVATAATDSSFLTMSTFLPHSLCLHRLGGANGFSRSQVIFWLLSIAIRYLPSRVVDWWIWYILPYDAYHQIIQKVSDVLLQLYYEMLVCIHLLVWWSMASLIVHNSGFCLLILLSPILFRNRI